jgi:transposase InsO family protein
MGYHTNDKTLKNKYIHMYQHLVSEYELIKQKRHPSFKTVGAFYKAHKVCAQVFSKYYTRYKQSGDIEAFMPGKRGPKYKTRRPDSTIEKLVLIEREKGCNKYEINVALKATLKDKTPSPSGVYTILKRYGKNRLSHPMQEEKRRIIKEKAGELAHIDCHYLPKYTVFNDPKRYYIVCVIDSCTRVAWAEVVDNIKALTVMFATLHCLRHISEKFNIKFIEAITDNGAEFGGRNLKHKEEHAFERMLMEIGVKHRYTRPYRPQTNGKVERFWRSMNEDLVQETHFDSIEHFKDELFQYLLYYNKLRPHQGLGGQIPEEYAKTAPRVG